MEGQQDPSKHLLQLLHGAAPENSTSSVYPPASTLSSSSHLHQNLPLPGVSLPMMHHQYPPPVPAPPSKFENGFHPFSGQQPNIPLNMNFQTIPPPRNEEPSLFSPFSGPMGSGAGSGNSLLSLLQGNSAPTTSVNLNASFPSNPIFPSSSR